MDAFGKIILFFVLSLLLFLSPAYYFAIKQDTIVQAIVYKDTVDFINTIKSTGKITQETYLRFLKKLDHTGNVYEIELEHQRMLMNPIILEDGSIQENTISQQYYNYYTDDILKEINNNHLYRLRKDDYISITVKNRNKTFGSKLQQALLNHNTDDTQIYVSYGGMIRDETE